MSYHIYIRERDIAENYSRYLNHKHFIIDKFLIEHHVKVLNVNKCEYYQNKHNGTGELVMEVVLDEKFTEPADTQKLLKALEDNRRKQVGK